MNKLGNADDMYRVPALKVLDEHSLDSGDNVVNFQSVHITLQEYMCAWYMVDELTRFRREGGGTLNDNVDYTTKEGVAQLRGRFLNLGTK